MNTLKQYLTICLIITTCINFAEAQVIKNGSFELAQVDPQNIYVEVFNGNLTINEWNIENGSVDLVNNLYWEASNGEQSIDLNGLQTGSISQSLTTIIDSTYCGTFDLAGNPDGSPNIKILNLSVADNSIDFTFDVTNQSRQNMGWEERSFEFTATDTLTQLTFSSLISGDAGAAIDNVQVVECYDCADILYGAAVIDECGKCLEPDDANFNQTCADCEGTLDGLMVFDECGVCLEPNDSTFNQTCIDCAGTPNGIAIIDECGECLELNDPNFNQTCSIYIPNVFSPNGDGINDRFQIFKKLETVAQINQFSVFSRWGELIYQAEKGDFNGSFNWWDGRFKGKKMQTGIYVYFIEVEFQYGIIKRFEGDITIVR